jgi:hypothetical protein
MHPAVPRRCNAFTPRTHQPAAVELLQAAPLGGSKQGWGHLPATDCLWEPLCNCCWHQQCYATPRQVLLAAALRSATGEHPNTAAHATRTHDSVLHQTCCIIQHETSYDRVHWTVCNCPDTSPPSTGSLCQQCCLNWPASAAAAPAATAAAAPLAAAAGTSVATGSNSQLHHCFDCCWGVPLLQLLPYISLCSCALDLQSYGSTQFPQ